jgi:hypothetical protein
LDENIKEAINVEKEMAILNWNLGLEENKTKCSPLMN